jgi:Cytochrome C oxidase, cbb3-type, subunit III
MKSPKLRMYYRGQVVESSWHEDPPTPQEAEASRRARRFWFIVAVAVLLLVLFVYWAVAAAVPVDYADIDSHFKYGSIGTEEGNGVPYRLWKVLPEMFPEYLPKSGRADYSALGFTYERGPGVPDTPIGFSKRRLYGLTFVGLNCAVCHTSTVRASIDGEPQVVLGMPAHKLDLLGYFDFLFHCAQDERFNTANLMEKIGPHLLPHEKLIYRIVLPQAKQRLMERKAQAAFMLAHPSGPGRIDTFTPYKTIQFGFKVDDDDAVGNADFPSLWNQQLRQGMELHWDGNNDSVFERNISASIGAGATPVSLDMPRMGRIRNWIETLPPPKYPFGHDGARAERGKAIYQENCAGCHDKGAAPYRTSDGHAYGVGQVVPLAVIGTDPDRLNSYTLDLSMNQYTLGSGKDWRFTHFRKTGGYANMPLDGVWARAPYLHNGSVPTLRDLLEPQSKRPGTFFKGNDTYDTQNVGFTSNLPDQGGRRFTPFDAGLDGQGKARVKGNGNGGHEYGTQLSKTDKDALIEYMKTL